MPLTRRDFACSTLAHAVPLVGMVAPAAVHAQGVQRAIAVSLSLEPPTLDPTMAASASIGEVVHYNVLEGLTKIEENGTVSPLLAKAWTRSYDGKTYTFVLRQDVLFHDGAPFDARAVKFSFERAKAPESTNKARKVLFDHITAITTPDAHTVVLQLDHADANLPFRLGENTAVILHPASAALAATQPVGTGPYRFASWKKGTGITLTRHAAFHRAAQVHIPEVTFRFINEPGEQVAAVLAGEVDMLFNIAPQNLARFQTAQHYQVMVGSSNGKGMLAINNRRKPLDNVRVRRAITHAIDREAFIKRMLGGRGKAIGSHFSPTEAGYVHLTGVNPHNPAKARALLKEAGVKLPLKLTLSLPPTPYARTDRDLLVDALADVGIQVQTDYLTWPQWLEGPFKGDFDLTMINHVEPLDYHIYGDPHYYFGYDSPAFRDLLARHAAADNARERQVLFASMQRHLANDAVNAWIYAAQVTAVSRKELRGWWMSFPILAHDIAALRWDA